MDNISVVKDKVDAKFTEFGELFKDHWLEFGALLISATRTFDIVKATSPAVWVPWAALGIMEGGYIWWRWKFSKAKNGVQTWTSVAMLVLTWLIVFVTIGVDAWWQAGLKGLFNLGPMPEWANLVAVFSVTALGMIHVAAYTISHIFDPDFSHQQEIKRTERSLKQMKATNDLELYQTKQQTALEIEKANQERDLALVRAQNQAALDGWNRVAPRTATLYGTQQFREDFFKQFGKYPEEVDKDIFNDPVFHASTSPSKNGNGHKDEPVIYQADTPSVELQKLDDNGTLPDNGNPTSR